MIAARRQQQSFADGLIHEAVGDLWGPWMRHADQALEDEALLLINSAGTRQALQEKQDPGLSGHDRRNHPSHDAVEAFSRLELCGLNARSTRQPGVSRVHAHRRSPMIKPSVGSRANSVLRWWKRFTSALSKSRWTRRLPPGASFEWIPPLSKPTFTIVCPVKAGVFSGSQPRRGKSQKPCSLDSREKGNCIPEVYRQSHPWDGEQVIGP